MRDVVRNTVTFVNVSAVYRRDHHGGSLAGETAHAAKPLVVVVQDGEITCVGDCSKTGEMVDLRGGMITPGLIVLGTSLGLDGVNMEPSTSEGTARDLSIDKPQRPMLRAIDALSLDSKDLKLARQRGVTRALSAIPGENNHGVGVLFDTGSKHAGQADAIVQSDAMVYVALGHTSETTSVAAQMGDLRRLLRKQSATTADSEAIESESDYFAAARRGVIPLVVGANKADVIVSLLRL